MGFIYITVGRHLPAFLMLGRYLVCLKCGVCSMSNDDCFNSNGKIEF